MQELGSIFRELIVAREVLYMSIIALLNENIYDSFVYIFLHKGKRPERVITTYHSS